MKTPISLACGLLLAFVTGACHCCPDCASDAPAPAGDSSSSARDDDPMNDESAANDGPVATRPATWQPLESGQDSALGELRFVVCRDAEAWQSLWRKHRSNQLPTPAAPAVDWSKEMMVGLVLGQRPSAGYTVEVEGIEIAGERMEFHAREETPDPDMVQAQVITCPYAFCRVERFGGRVDLVLAGE